MIRKLVCAFWVLAVCLVTVTCTKLESSNPPGPLAFASSKFADAIPDDYGQLVGVTQNPQDPQWVGLWFQKSDKTIIAVFVNVEQRKISEKALTIPRK